MSSPSDFSRSASGTVLATFLVGLCSANGEVFCSGTAFSEDGGALAARPALVLEWNDAYRLVPTEVDEVAYQVASLFGAVGVQVGWKQAGEAHEADRQTFPSGSF